MTKFNLEMELISDLCPASGDGFAGVVDMDVCFDDLGLPYIPAKRLKGCLRECGLDIISVDESHASVFSRLFGETGKFLPGDLTIGNGKLKDYTQIAEGIGKAHVSEITEVFTQLRSRTRIEKGTAAPGSLRTVRVLARGQFYVFPVELPEDAVAFFKKCVKSLRGIGVSRSRGLGEVCCELKPYVVNEKREAGRIFSTPGDKGSFSYSLELIRPVISAHRSGKTSETEDYIFGSAILGALADKYIKSYSLNRNEAYKDPDFRRLFLEGSLKFTAALPSQDGKAYYPAPLVLRTDKLKKQLVDETLEIADDSSIAKRLGGFVCIEADGTVKTLVPSKTAFAHHARPTDKSLGHATENDGEFYTYEALAAGQTFAGSVIGEPADIEKLAALFEDDATLKIGRSRTAQYGLAKIAPTETGLAANKLSLTQGDMFRLVAVTPIILEDDSGVNRLDIGLIKAALGEGFEVLRSVCAETVVGGYYGKWLLPKRQLRAVAEGSTLAFRYNGEKISLSIDFLGERTGEGFGRVRLEKIPEATAFTLAPENKPVATKTDEVLPEVKELRAKKEAIAEGVKYGKEGRFMNLPKGSTLARILAALKQAENYGKFAQYICDIRQSSQKQAALVFATGKPGDYFSKNPEHLSSSHVAHLLEQCGHNYETYQIYLNAAAQRIKQKRRSAENRNGGQANEKL